jgi:hypothetical protein
MRKKTKIDLDKIHPDCYIYKITCLDPKILHFYIGSTINYNSRKACHASKCKSLPNSHLYSFINQYGGWKNWKMEIIEHLKNVSIKTKKLEEKKWIDQFKPYLNKNVIGRDIKQYQKDNREVMYMNQKKYRLKNLEKSREYLKRRYNENKEKYRASARKSYENNKEKIKERRNKKVVCLCGREVKLYRRQECIKSAEHSKRLKKIFGNINV